MYIYIYKHSHFSFLLVFRRVVKYSVQTYRDSSVGLVTRLREDRPIKFSIPEEGKKFFSIPTRPDIFWDSPRHFLRFSETFSETLPYIFWDSLRHFLRLSQNPMTWVKGSHFLWIKAVVGWNYSLISVQYPGEKYMELYFQSHMRFVGCTETTCVYLAQ